MIVQVLNSMNDVDQRLQNLLKDQIGDCCEGDIQRRLSKLKEFKQNVPDSYKEDIKAMKALSSETKYKILRLLIEAEKELCVCEITPLFEVSESAISHALTDLKNTSLVEKRKEGKWRYYKPTYRAEKILETFDKTRNGR